MSNGTKRKSEEDNEAQQITKPSKSAGRKRARQAPRKRDFYFEAFDLEGILFWKVFSPVRPLFGSAVSQRSLP